MSWIKERIFCIAVGTTLARSFCLLYSCLEMRESELPTAPKTSLQEVMKRSRWSELLGSKSDGPRLHRLRGYFENLLNDLN
jgi:hypothetical protein